MMYGIEPVLDSGLESPEAFPIDHNYVQQTIRSKVSGKKVATTIESRSLQFSHPPVCNALDRVTK
jgi:hypothetical protein